MRPNWRTMAQMANSSGMAGDISSNVRAAPGSMGLPNVDGSDQHRGVHHHGGAQFQAVSLQCFAFQHLCLRGRL
jgi:hypothetical protein